MGTMAVMQIFSLFLIPSFDRWPKNVNNRKTNFKRNILFLFFKSLINFLQSPF